MNIRPTVKASQCIVAVSSIPDAGTYFSRSALWMLSTRKILDEARGTRPPDFFSFSYFISKIGPNNYVNTSYISLSK